MLKHLTISRQAFVGICLLLLIELGFFGSLVVLLNKARSNLERERHEQQVVSRLNNVANVSQKIGIAMIRSASPAELLQFVETSTDYHGFMGDLDKEITNLKGLVRNEPETLNRLDQLEKACWATCRYYDSQQSVFRNSPANFYAFTDRMFELSSRVTRGSQELIKQYHTTERPKSGGTAHALNEIMSLIFVAALVNIVGAVLVALFLVNRVTGRLSVLTDNIERFSRQEPLNRRILDADEIGKIDLLFHEMTTAINLARRNETALIANASEVICQLDENGVFITVSPSVKQQWGFDHEELIGSHYTRVIRTKEIEDVNEKIERLLETGSRVSFEAHVKNNADMYIDSMWSVYWSPSAESYFCFVHNITERKNMEALLAAQEEQVRTATENIPVGLITINRDGLIQSVNATTERLVGRTRQDLTSRPMLSVIQSESRSDELLLNFERNDTSTPIRCMLKQPDGRHLPVDVTSTQIAAAGKTNILLVIDDVSERVKLETMKEDFVNILGRNLREPLNATSVNIAELLGLTQKESKKFDRLSRVSSNIERLLRLIDELLSIQKLGAGKLVGSLERSQVANIVTDAVEAIKDHAEQQGVSISSQPANAFVMADSERLVQVLINLIGNAIKFSPRESTVKVSVETRGNEVEFSITDSGRGVPQEMQQSIFEQYVQTTVADGKRGKGTGLGLSICKSIVEGHNGTIGVESEEGHGSRFWFIIPREVGDES